MNTLTKKLESTKKGESETINADELKTLKTLSSNLEEIHSSGNITYLFEVKGMVYRAIPEKDKWLFECLG